MSASNSSNRPYDYVLFDWDGCIADSVSVWFGAFRATCEKFSLDPTDAQIYASIGSWESVRTLGVTDATFDAFLAELVGNANRRIMECEFFDGIAELLVKLRNAGSKTAVVSSAQHSNLAGPLQRLGKDKHFDVIVAGDDVTNHKPHAEPIRVALQRLGYTSGRVIMLGDTENDIGAGAAAGVDTMLMRHPGSEVYRSLDELLSYEPTHVCRSFREAAAILLPGSPRT